MLPDPIRPSISLGAKGAGGCEDEEHHTLRQEDGPLRRLWGRKCTHPNSSSDKAPQTMFTSRSFTPAHGARRCRLCLCQPSHYVFGFAASAASIPTLCAFIARNCIPQTSNTACRVRPGATAASRRATLAGPLANAETTSSRQLPDPPSNENPSAKLENAEKGHREPGLLCTESSCGGIAKYSSFWRPMSVAGVHSKFEGALCLVRVSM